MKNPWLELNAESEQYLLEMDRDEILRFNTRVHPECRIVLDSIPEPFIGNPESARVVLLLLNPGHVDSDRESHRVKTFKRSLIQNLHHQPQDYPFYPLNPLFESTGSAKWWLPRTRELLRESGLDRATLARRLLAIEWFPYHSRNSVLARQPLCESQEYTFQIAREMLRTKFVLVMRSVNHWANVDVDFLGVPRLKIPRSCYISKGNMDGGLFDELLRKLGG
jgi:hypothetical protein